MAKNDEIRTDLGNAEVLWKSADALRGQIDAAEYKHVVLAPSSCASRSPRASRARSGREPVRPWVVRTASGSLLDTPYGRRPDYSAIF